MSALFLVIISFSCILAGTFSGFYLSRRLPEHHVNSDAKDTVKMAWGIVATMAALVLSLLLSSAKASFETVNSEMTQTAAKIIVLNQILIRYGPEAKPARDELRNRIAIRIQKIWPTVNGAVTESTGLESGQGMVAVQDKLYALVPQTDAQRTLLAQAQQLTSDLVMERWLVVEQSRASLPIVFFWVLVAWLTMLFIGIGLFAPANKTVFITLILCNLALSGAIFLIEELNHPLNGLIKVSSTPMIEALDHLKQE